MAPPRSRMRMADAQAQLRRTPRANYSDALRRHLDSHFTPADMARRLLDMSVRLELLKGRLLRNEFELTRSLSSAHSSPSHDSVSLDELRRHVLVRCVRLASRLQARAPVPPPAVRWSTMRDEAMQARRQSIRRFQRWDTRMNEFVAELKVAHNALAKLCRRAERRRARRNNAVQRHVDKVYTAAKGTRRTIYVLFKS